MNVIDDVQKWYAANCDGYWEHGCGVKIETLDNPGWSVSINLKDTNLEGKRFESFQRETSEERWISCRVEGDEFRGFGDETKLEEILKVFLEWAKSQNEDWLKPLEQRLRFG